MVFDFPVYTLLFIIGGAICLGLAVMLWNRRPAPGILPLTLLLFAGGFWTHAAAFEAAAIELSTKILCTKILYLAVVSTGVFWLAFALDYSGYTWWKRPRNLILLSLIPLITLILAWTNDLHGWLWSSITLVEGPLGPTSVWGHGPWYLVNPIYQYLLYAAGIVILLRFGWRKPWYLRQQVLLILAATLMSIIGSILYVVGIKPAAGFDITPFYISVSAIIYGIIVVRYRFMNLTPAAYKTLVQSIPDGVIILDSLDHILEINPAAEKIIGQSESSVRGKNLAGVWPELDRIIFTSKDLSHFELTSGKKNAPRNMDVSISALIDSRRKTTGRLVVLRDIQELKNAQLRLEKLYNEEHDLRSHLEEEMQKRSQYSRAVVHELRTPLTSIIISSDILEEQIKDQMQKRLVQGIRRSSENLNQRVNELFELARGEVGMLTINPGPCDLRQLIQEVAVEMAPVAGAKGLQLKTEIAAQELVISGDRNRIRQVILNLVSNAVKFTEKGEILIRAGYNNPDFLLVQVADTGAGMSREQLANLFDPYRRNQKEWRTTGLGIGLALSKIFVELHHGKIWAESTEGKGATISFTLPLNKSYLTDAQGIEGKSRISPSGV